MGVEEDKKKKRGWYREGETSAKCVVQREVYPC